MAVVMTKWQNTRRRLQVTALLYPETWLWLCFGANTDRYTAIEYENLIYSNCITFDIVCCCSCLILFCEASCWSGSVAWAACRWEACIWDACSCWLYMAFVWLCMWQDLERWGPWLLWVQDANDIWQRRWWRWRCRWRLFLDCLGLLICYIRMDCIYKGLQNTQLHVNDVDRVNWHRGLSMLVSADVSLSTVEIVKLSMHWKLDVKPHMLVLRTSFAGDCQRGWGVRCSYDITTSRMWKESATLHDV